MITLSNMRTEKWVALVNGLPKWAALANGLPWQISYQNGLPWQMGCPGKSVTKMGCPGKWNGCQRQKTYGPIPGFILTFGPHLRALRRSTLLARLRSRPPGPEHGAGVRVAADHGLIPGAAAEHRVRHLRDRLARPSPEALCSRAEKTQAMGSRDQRKFRRNFRVTGTN